MKEDKQAREAEKKAAADAVTAAHEAERRAVAEAERLRAFRERLYERGSTTAPFVRHSLSNAPTNQTQRPSQSTPVQQPTPSIMPRMSSSATQPVVQTPLAEPLTYDAMSKPKLRRSYRFKILIIGLIFFVGAFLVSSGFFFWGNNLISGNNIAVVVSGPLALSGGDSLSLLVTVSNNNEVPIESATLIVRYPPGTQSIKEPGREIYTDRIELNKIAPGEVVKVPIQTRIFGEENQEKLVGVAIEYRVAGSNATFSREAESFKFTINTSPIVLNVNAEPSIASGKEIAIVLSVQSNSTVEFSNLLVKVNYPPTGFSLRKSEPSAVSGQDTWQVPTLKPGEKFDIIITGSLDGAEDEKKTFAFSVGVPSDRDRFNLASILSTAATEILIEPPLIGLEVTIERSTNEFVVVAPNQNSAVSISFQNPLRTVLYDGKLSVVFSGETFGHYEVNNKGGFYKSETRTLTWDAVDVPKLKELKPGDSVNVNFDLRPNTSVPLGTSPEFKLVASVSGRRLTGDVATNVSNSVERTIKVSSDVKYRAALLYTEGPFQNSGPTPPVAGETTEYTLYLRVEAGSNPVKPGQVTAILPPYVRWQDRVSDGDDVTYNPITRTLTWKVEELEAATHTEAWVQLAFLPSSSQVGRTPTIVEAQRYTAVDAFTGLSLRSDAVALTTALREEPDRKYRDGTVQD